MQPVHLFDLVSRHIGWASFRQTVVTSNIANANSPGYESQDVKPFVDVLNGVDLTMAQTTAGHMSPVDSSSGQTGTEGDGFGVTLTGNSVSLEQELIKADDINRSISLDLTVERAFHRMILNSVRSAG